MKCNECERKRKNWEEERKIGKKEIIVKKKKEKV